MKKIKEVLAKIPKLSRIQTIILIIALMLLSYCMLTVHWHWARDTGLTCGSEPIPINKLK